MRQALPPCRCSTRPQQWLTQISIMRVQLLLLAQKLEITKPENAPAASAHPEISAALFVEAKRSKSIDAI